MGQLLSQSAFEKDKNSKKDSKIDLIIAYLWEKCNLQPTISHKTN